MSYLSQIALDETFPPFALFKERFGFIPNLFRAQTLLPRLIEIEARIAGTLLLHDVTLPRRQKEMIMLAVAACERNDYCVTAHCRFLRELGVEEDLVNQVMADHRRAGLEPGETALLDFSIRLSRNPERISQEDIESLRGLGLTDEQVLEAIQVTALTRFLCALSVGVGARPDFPPRSRPERGPVNGKARSSPDRSPRLHPGYLRAPDLGGPAFPPFAFFERTFGFIPNIFKAQSLRPDMIEVETEAVRGILVSEDHLSRVRKEFILLAVSAANTNSYCVAVHCEILRGLGVDLDIADRVALDHRNAGLPAEDVALLDFALKLGRRPLDYGRPDPEGLMRLGFTQEQVLEAVVMTALTNFLNTLQMGLGVEADFDIGRYSALVLNPRPDSLHPIPESLSRPADSTPVDEERELIIRILAGDEEAFETIVIRHERRLYRLLMGMTGNTEDARDGVQTTFLKAYRHLADFHGDSRLSTWLTRIALNEGLERIRSRKPAESLEDRDPAEDPPSPARAEAWDEHPESRYEREEIRRIVEREMLKLPAKYRIVITLRDVEQIPTREAAAMLDLAVPALKSRLLRGRLLLRDALTPYFAGARAGGRK